MIRTVSFVLVNVFLLAMAAALCAGVWWVAVGFAFLTSVAALIFVASISKARLW